MYKIENNLLEVQIRSLGGEMRAITEKADGTEYLWDGNPEFWRFSSPTLFPIIGSVVNNKYKYNGETYELPSHGLGRISEFEVVNQEKDKISLALTYSEESLKKYPFKFRLTLTYALQDKNVLVNWKVENLDDKTMYFSIGAHPALRCPIAGIGNFEDCYLEFSKEENSGVFELAPGCLVAHSKRPFLNGRRLQLNYDLFREDARMFNDLKSDTVMVRSTKTHKAIGIEAKGFPFYGIWSPVKGGAPFICLEPWQGHADYFDFTGDISEKEGILSLEPSKVYETGYQIIIE